MATENLDLMLCGQLSGRVWDRIVACLLPPRTTPVRADWVHRCWTVRPYGIPDLSHTTLLRLPRHLVGQLVWLVPIGRLGFGGRLPMAFLTQAALVDRHVPPASDVVVDRIRP